MRERRGVVIRFPIERRIRGSLAILSAYGQVSDIERSASRLVWASVAATAVMMGALQIFTSL
jgi:hypothetical protein